MRGGPGDVWNSEDVYWLVEGSNPGARMSYRSVAPGDATLRITAMATGTWSDNRLYESMLFGPDGDNWFHAELTADGYATSAVHRPKP